MPENNPTSITASALLIPGLVADSLSIAAWTIINAGRVFGAGATLDSIGTVVNAGSIGGPRPPPSDAASR